MAVTVTLLQDASATTRCACRNNVSRQSPFSQTLLPFGGYTFAASECDSESLRGAELANFALQVFNGTFRVAGVLALYQGWSAVIARHKAD